MFDPRRFTWGKGDVVVEEPVPDKIKKLLAGKVDQQTLEEILKLAPPQKG
jgi:hypothetical protein